MQNDLAELIELIHLSETNKDQVHSAYLPDSTLAASEIQGLNLQVAKLKDKNQQLLYENKVIPNQALKNRYRMLINLNNNSNTIKESLNDFDDSENQEMMYRVLRKLNQDASYALDQFKEAIIQNEEDYEED